MRFGEGPCPEAAATMADDEDEGGEKAEAKKAAEANAAKDALAKQNQELTGKNNV